MREKWNSIVKKRRKSTSLRISMINSFFFCAVFVLVALVSGIMNYKSYISEERDGMESCMSVSLYAVDSTLRDMERVSLMSMTADETQEIIAKYGKSTQVQKNAAEKYLNDYFTSLITIRNDIKGIYLFDQEEMIFYYDAHNPSRSRDVNAKTEMEKIVKSGSEMPGSNSILSTTEMAPFFKYGGKYTKDTRYNTEIWLIKEVMSFSPYEKIGTIIMTVSAEKFQTLLNQTITEETIYVLCGDDGKIISADDASLIGKNVQDLSAEMYDALWKEESDVVWQGQKCRVEQMQSQYSGYHLIVGKTHAQLFKPVKRMLLIGIPLLLIAMAAVIFASFYNVRRILSPMKELSEGMSNFDENSLHHRYQVVSNDEVGILVDSFNKMLDMMESLIEDKYVNEMKIKESQLTEQKLSMLYLKSQINPHFLYNTIDTIRIQAEINGDKKVATLLMHLVDFFRLSVKVDEQMVTLEHEYEMIHAYLELMCYRYPGLTCVYEIDPQLNDKYVPNFILQPLVENSLLHGLRNKGYCGSIAVIASFVEDQEDLIEIQVIDTGIGFDEDTRKHVNALLQGAEVNMEDSSAITSIGIINVHRRLKLLCGKDCGLWYSENENAGVTAHVRLRVNRTGGNNEINTRRV